MIVIGSDGYVRAGEAAGLLGPDVTADMVRTWGSRGLATRYRRRGATWYRLAELVEAEHRTRSSTRGRRRAA